MAGRWGCIEESCSLRKEACSGRQSLFYFSIVNFAGKKKLKFKVLCSSFKVLNAGTMRWWNVLFMIIGNYCFGITFFCDICCILYQINMFLHLKDNICKPERLCSTTILHKMLFWHTLSTLSHKLQLLWFRYCNFNNILINCAALV